MRWLREALTTAKNGLHQGIYVVTPGGELLAQADGGWPVYDPLVTLRALRQAKARYALLPPERRLLETEPDPLSDRAWPVPDDAPLPGQRRLAATLRSRPFAGMELGDVRHPRYLQITALDVRESWLTGLVPALPAVGATARADDALLFAFALGSMMHPGCAVWREDEIRERDLVATVAAVDGPRVALDFHGRLSLAADNQWNRNGAYEGRIGGRAVWLSDERRFESFELALLGTHTLSESERSTRPGSPSYDVAAHLVLVQP